MERPAALLDERFSVYFPPDSWVLPAAAERHLRAKCDQIRAYLAAADRDTRERGAFYFVSGHADDRENGGMSLARRRRKAVEQILSSCAEEAHQQGSNWAEPQAEAQDEEEQDSREAEWDVERKRERQVGAARQGKLCDWRKDNDPRDEGRGRWRRVRLFWTSVEGLHVPTRLSLVSTPRLSFRPDSGEIGPGVAKALDGESGTCQNLRKHLRNWRRGLLVVGYASRSEADADGLAARRAEAVLRRLRGECRLDAGQLFPVARRPVVDTGIAARRRRVDVGTELYPCRWPSLAIIEERNWVGQVVFELGSSEIAAEYKSLLTDACGYLKGTDSVVEIHGYARPDEKDGKGLSQSRADAVKKWLGACGVDPSHIRSKGQPSTEHHGRGARLEILP